jgi:hypothetical protein
MQRADGLGNPDGAFDRGDLSGSIKIMKRDWNQVTVGTRLRRAKTLALGLPDPSVTYEDIKKWKKRKNISLGFLVNWEKGKLDPDKAWILRVTKKIQRKGPIPNPFHIRSEKEFVKELPDLIRRCQLK